MLKINDAAKFRRIGSGICLIAGPLILLVGLLLSPELGSRTPDEVLTAYEANPVRAQVAAVLVWFGFVLFVPAIFSMSQLVRRRAVTLGHVGLALGVLGFATLPGAVSTDFFTLGLAEWSDRQTALAILEAASSYPLSLAIFLPMLLGTALSLVLLPAAIWRAGFAPFWVPLAAVAAVILQFVSRALPGLPLVLSTVLLLVSFGYVGLRILRLSDQEWEEGTLAASSWESSE